MKIDLSSAVDRLLSADVVAIPTETVYGLAASLERPHAIEKIFSLKKRPADNPLIVHVADLGQASSLIASFPPGAEKLAAFFWPGPLTLIFQALPDKVPESVRAGLPTVGLRIPNHPLALELLKATGPLVAPSANLSGRPSATCPSHVERDFGKEFPLLDGGPCLQGVESTILYFADQTWVIGRLGAIPPEEIGSRLGQAPLFRSSGKPICPGQKYRHYAPKAELVAGKGPYQGRPEVVIGFEGRLYPGARRVISLGPLSKPQLVASRLYRSLRQLDEEGIGAAWIDCNLPEEGLFLTIRERLERACGLEAYPRRHR